MYIPRFFWIYEPHESPEVLEPELKNLKVEYRDMTFRITFGDGGIFGFEVKMCPRCWRHQKIVRTWVEKVEEAQACVCFTPQDDGVEN